MSKTFVRGLLSLSLILILASCTKSPVLYMAGDSTMAEKSIHKAPETGWGQALPEFFQETIRIENHARNGRSTRSFRYEGRWDSLLKKVEKGDYVIIQFGHNDEVESKIGRHSTPEEYAYNISGFISDVRSRNAHPILCTHIVRRSFDEEGDFYNTHGEYPGIVRKLAVNLDVPLLDMQKLSEALLRELGKQESKKYFLHLEPGENPNYPKGVRDNTHVNREGAMVMAELAVQEMLNLEINLKNHLK